VVSWQKGGKVVRRIKRGQTAFQQFKIMNGNKIAPPYVTNTPSISLMSKRTLLNMDSRSSSPEFSPLTISEDLTPLPTYKFASTASISFSNLLEPPLRLHEDLKSGCGGQLWPAGMVLAHHMLRYHRNSMKDARMYDSEYT
jgi:hypothetical protein